MSDVVMAIGRGWLGTAATGAPNYDEFASDAEVTAAIEAHPESVLAIEMPHRTPAAVAAGLDFTAALSAAADRWDELCATTMRELHDTFALYRITGATEFVGCFALVATDQISSSPAEPGRVIRNEDVFVEKVRERVALTEALSASLSPVLLLAAGDTASLHDFLRRRIAAAGHADVAHSDDHGNLHEVWLAPPAPDLRRAFDDYDLIVADGNHRSLAAQQAGVPAFLAVVTTAESVRIAPYNRLLSSLGPVGVPELLDRLRGAGAQVVAAGGGEPAAGEIVLYSREGQWRVVLPASGGATVDGLDHSVVERVLIRDVLGMDPGDKRIGYVGGDYPAQWLRDRVDAGVADLAVFIAPVQVADFVAVNVDRAKMPRKSTWFVPKARAGLIASSAQVAT